MAGKGNKEPTSRELCAALTVLAPEGVDKPSGVFRFPGYSGTLRLWRVDPHKLRAIADSLDLDADAFGPRLDMHVVADDDAADAPAPLDALDYETALDFAAAAFDE
jgi:hypothetical protein